MATTGSPVQILLLTFLLFATLKNLHGTDTDQIELSSQNVSKLLNFTFVPPSLDKLVWKKTSQVVFQVHSELPDDMQADADTGTDGDLCVLSEDDSIAAIPGSNVVPFNLYDSDKQESFNESSFTVQGVFLGRTRLRFFTRTSADEKTDLSNLLQNYSNIYGSINYSIAISRINTQCTSIGGQIWRQLPDSLPVAVVRPDRMVDKLFIAVVTLLVVVANIGMGCKIDLAVVKEVLKRPVAPIIGFCCQFIIMPLVCILLVIVSPQVRYSDIFCYIANCF